MARGQTICDWCGAPGEVIGHDRWLWGAKLELWHCTGCHHEWQGEMIVDDGEDNG